MTEQEKNEQIGRILGAAAKFEGARSAWVHLSGEDDRASDIESEFYDSKAQLEGLIDATDAAVLERIMTHLQMLGAHGSIAVRLIREVFYTKIQ